MKTYEEEPVYITEVMGKDLPDIIITFGTNRFNESMTRHGAHRSQVLFAQLRFQAKRGVENLLMAMRSNLSISQNWKTRRGKLCHSVLEKLYAKLLPLHQIIARLEEKEFQDIEFCLRESSCDADWQQLRHTLGSLKGLADEVWSTFMKSGMEIVNYQMKSLTRQWKDLNPNMPDMLYCIKVALIGILTTFEMAHKVFKPVAEYWMGYIDYHWGMCETARPPTPGWAEPPRLWDRDDFLL